MHNTTFHSPLIFTDDWSALQVANGLLLNHVAERALLDHHAHDLVQHIGGGHGGVLGVGVVGRLLMVVTVS